MAGVVLFIVAILANAVAAQNDIFVDDWFGRSQIKYDPPTVWISGSIIDRYAKTITFTNSTGASATFKFSGIGIQYMGYADKSSPNTTGILEAELDGTKIPIPGNLGLLNPAQQILFQKQGLDNGDHTIIIRKIGPTLPGFDLNVDAFIYRVPDPPTTTAPSTTAPGSTTSPSGTVSNSSFVGPIVGGVVGAIAAGGIIAFLIWYFFLRHRKGAVKSVDPSVVDHVVGHPMGPEARQHYSTGPAPYIVPQSNMSFHKPSPSQVPSSPPLLPIPPQHQPSGSGLSSSPLYPHSTSSSLPFSSVERYTTSSQHSSVPGQRARDGDAHRPRTREGDVQRPKTRDGDTQRPRTRDGDMQRPRTRDGERPRTRDGEHPRTRDGERPRTRDGDIHQSQALNDDLQRPRTREGDVPRLPAQDLHERITSPPPPPYTQ